MTQQQHTTSSYFQSITRQHLKTNASARGQPTMSSVLFKRKNLYGVCIALIILLILLKNSAVDKNVNNFVEISDDDDDDINSADRLNFNIDGNDNIDMGGNQVEQEQEPEGEEEEEEEIVHVETHETPESIGIIRIIRNDFYPEQRFGTAFYNLKFILNNEEKFENVKKVWVIDRIKDAGYLKKIKKLLAKHKQEVIDLEYKGTNVTEKSEETIVNDITKFNHKTLRKAQKHGQSLKTTWYTITDAHRIFTKESIRRLTADIESTPVTQDILALKTYSFDHPQQDIVVNSDISMSQLDDLVAINHAHYDFHSQTMFFHKKAKTTFNSAIRNELALTQETLCFADGDETTAENEKKVKLCNSDTDSFSIELYRYPNYLLQGDKVKITGPKAQRYSLNDDDHNEKICSIYEPEDFELKNEEDPRMVIYRIYGNDVVPLQMKGQLLNNLKFTLENEKKDIGVVKRWVLNRVVEKEMEDKMVAVLEEHGYTEDNGSVVRLPFEVEGLANIALNDTDGFIEYATNLNLVRNQILEMGKTDPAKFHWILLFDGNQFLTEEGLNRLVSAAKDRDRNRERYFSVPMCRLKYSQDDLQVNFKTKVADLLQKNQCFLQEPQLMFRWNSCQNFDVGFAYGKRSKLQFLTNLGCYSVGGGICSEAGYVFRLYPFPNDDDYEPLEIIINHSVRDAVRKKSLALFIDRLHTLRESVISEN